MALGSNMQKFTIELDTGSEPFWVSSVSCSNCKGNHFDPSSSKTFKKYQPGKVFSIVYDDGTDLTGYHASDTLSVGGLIYNDFVFGLVDKGKIPAGGEKFTIGILGLAPIYEGELTTEFLSLLKKDSAVVEKSFSFHFPKSVNDYGEFYIGGSNKNLYDERTLQWSKAKLEDESWMFDSISLVFPDGTKSDSNMGILDTGSDTIVMPSKVLKSFCKSIKATMDRKSQMCVTACNNPNLKNFNIVLGGLKLEMDVNDHFLRKTSNGNCELAFEGDKAKYGYTIGLVFLRQYYTIWDFGNGRVGFAKPIVLA
jgi:hypothetical protein